MVCYTKYVLRVNTKFDSNIIIVHDRVIIGEEGVRIALEQFEADNKKHFRAPKLVNESSKKIMSS